MTIKRVKTYKLIAIVCLSALTINKFFEYYAEGGGWNLAAAITQLCAVIFLIIDFIRTRK